MTIVKSHPADMDFSSKTMFYVGPNPGSATWTYNVSKNSLTNSVAYPDLEKGRDYKTLIKQKRSATTLLSGIKYRQHSMGLLSCFHTGTSTLGDTRLGRYEGLVHIGTPAVPVISQQTLNVARGKFLQKCRDAQRPFMSGVALGEIRETIHLIRHPLQALYASQLRFSQKVKKLSERRLIYRTKHDLIRESHVDRNSNRRRSRLADLWLEYSYGWKPLYGDIISGCEALSRMSYSPPTVRVVSNFGTDWQSSSSFNTSWVQVPISYSTVNRFRTTVRHSGAIKLRPGVSQAVGFDYRSLGFLEILPTCWELIPYSFLLDYFVNIGQILDAATFLTCDIAWAQETVRRLCSCTVTPVWGTLPQGQYTLNSGFATRSQPRWSSVVAFDRAPYSGAWVPTLSFKIPESPLRWLNMLALARNFNSSDGRRNLVRD